MSVLMTHILSSHISAQSTFSTISIVRIGDAGRGIQQNSCSCDPIAGFHPVNTFLKPFSKLLLASGVKPAIYPEPSEPTSNSAVLRTAFRGMCEKQELMDVVFKAEDDDNENEDEEETILPAHRAYLVACGDHFKALFTGAFAESRPASANDIRIPVKGYSSKCVSVVLDYTYTGEIPQAGRNSYFLLEVLGLSNYWGMKVLHEEIQRTIIGQRLITPETLEQLRSRAEVAQGW